jgi:DNA-entry nuclease
MSRKKKKSNNSTQTILAIIVLIVISIIGYFNPDIQEKLNDLSIGSTNEESQTENVSSYDLSSIPEYDGEAYVIINNNIPDFSEEDYTTESFEKYSKLDSLGRCGVAYANICRETMPPEGDTRGDISSVKPTGWVQKKYDGQYLYNRCHLIGYQLSDEDANELNLITGTRYFNVTGMLVFENQVADYINKQSADEDRHVLYRVTPYFQGTNLVASGVQMEAYSVEDNGEGVCFNVYVYNVQPGITIDYSTGESTLSE